MSKKTNVLVLIALLMSTANIFADTFLSAESILVSAHHVVLIFAFPSPVRRRVAEAGQGYSDEYV
jgi:hypothetical protein